MSPLDGAHHVFPATAVTLVVAAMIAPIAYWQHGQVGAGVVAVAAATIVLSLWLAAWLTTSLWRAGRTTGGLLAAAALRMVPPLALALALVMGDGQLVPAKTVLYVVPLYLSMLCAQTVGALGRPGGSRRQEAPCSGPAGSAGVSQG